MSAAPSQDRRRRRNAKSDAVRQGLRPIPPAKIPPARVLKQIRALLMKDIITEWRTRETLVTLLFFALLLVIIFAFSMGGDEEVVTNVAPGIIWIAVAFTGTLAIDRSFAQEQEGETLTALVLVPGAARALFASKTLLNIFYMLLVEALVVPLVVGILAVPLPGDAILPLCSALLLGTIGFAAVGTVFSAMLVSVRRRGVLLPIILYPVLIPLLVIGVEATAVLVSNFPLSEAWSWVKMMAAVDVLYLLGGGWLFGFVTEDE